MVAYPIVPYRELFPAMEIIILFFALRIFKGVFCIILLCFLGIFTSLVYDVPISLSIFLNFVGYYCNSFLVSKGYLSMYSSALTNTLRFAVFAFILLTVKYIMLIIYWQYLFNYFMLLIQYIITVCYYPLSLFILNHFIKTDVNE